MKIQTLQWIRLLELPGRNFEITVKHILFHSKKKPKGSPKVMLYFVFDSLHERK